MKKLWIVLLLLPLLSCEKDEIEAIDCDNFYNGVVNLNSNQVKTEIEKLTVDLSPTITAEDPIGHAANFNLLIERLNDNCDSYAASENCYACGNINTFPVQSEILLEFTEGQSFIIRIHTPENDILRFADILAY